MNEISTRRPQGQLNRLNQAIEQTRCLLLMRRGGGGAGDGRRGGGGG